MRVDGAAAVVVGGASGLGEGAVRALTEAGMACTIADIDEPRGEMLAQELGGRTRFVRVDITDPASLEALFADERPEPLRVVVVSAFSPGGQRVVSRAGIPHDRELFGRLIAINLVGTFDVMRLGAAAIARTPPLEDGERGVIVCTSSIAAFDGQEGQCAYTAAKAAIAGMTLPAARDLVPHGIRAMTIAPGTFLTPAVARLPQEAQDAFRDVALTPGRLGDPSEYGNLVRQIAENSYLNGETIRLDGGARLPARR